MAADQDLSEPGPIKTVRAFGHDVPYYVLTFDRQGACTSPLSLEQLLGQLRAGAHKDVLLYSHGWNNDYPTAIERFDTFLASLSKTAATHPDVPAGFSPAFVGIVWPSTALTFGDEKAPDILADIVEEPDQAFENEAAQLLGALAPPERAEARALLDAPEGVGGEAAARLAELIAPHLDDTLLEVASGPPDAGDLLQAWRSQPTAAAEPVQEGLSEFGVAGGGGAADAQAAGFLSYLDPRWIVRVATVLLMKTRAGLVGRGVGAAVEQMLAIPGFRLFMIGHSYGAKVVMSALATRAVARPAEAVMLLQPAVSNLCFAENIGDGHPGGFRAALAKVRKPVFVTYSNNDIPLHRLFHLAARRKEDVGELQPLGAPSRYAALGGFGPGGCAADECVFRRFAAPPARDVLPAAPARIVAFDGTGIITGHGVVHGPEVMWALCSLLG